MYRQSKMLWSEIWKERKKQGTASGLLAEELKQSGLCACVRVHVLFYSLFLPETMAGRMKAG